MSSPSRVQRLPPEVLHMIFTYLKPRDVTSMRQQCRLLAEVGLHHLLRSYHLIFKKSSFKRLLEISQHPVVCRYVTSIFYEADALPEYHTMDEWEKNISDINFPANMERAPPLRGFSERQQRVWHRGFKKSLQGPRWTLSKSQLRQAFEIYQTYIEDQDDMRLRDYNIQILSDAMKSFPNLASLRMSMRFGMEIRSNYVKRAFSHALQKPCGDDHQVNSCGVPQLRSLLLGIAANGIPLQELQFGFVDWRFLKADKKTFSKFKKAIGSLKNLYIMISTASSKDDPDDDNIYHPSTIDCLNFMQKGRLRDFTSAAPNLTQFGIQFDSNNPRPPARLSDITGDFIWNSLQSVYFSLISCTSPGLIDFYKRHSATLKKVGLDDIKLTEGLWQDTFREMKQVLRVKKLSIAGVLWEQEIETYYFGLPPRSACSHDTFPLIKRVVELYILDPREDLVLPDLRDIPTISDYCSTDEDENEGSSVADSSDSGFY